MGRFLKRLSLVQFGGAVGRTGAGDASGADGVVGEPGNPESWSAARNEVMPDSMIASVVGRAHGDAVCAGESLSCGAS